MSNFGPCFHRCYMEFEKRLQKHCLTVTNGTVAIEVALKTLLRPGARVALPDFTHSGTLLAIVAAGCTPVIMPTNKDTWTIDLEFLNRNADCFDAVVVVSPFGYFVDSHAYEKFAHDYGKALVYDFAGAWGSHPRTRWPVCYSFHATKNFSIGEGGLVCFDDPEEYERAQRLINFGTLPDRTIEGIRGTNDKLDEVKCAMILALLEHEDNILKKITHKKRLMREYQMRLSGLCEPHDLAQWGSPSMCVLGGFKNARVLEAKSKEFGVVVRRYYPLLSQNPSLRKYVLAPSELFFETCLALPSDCSDTELEKVVEFVRLWK